MDKTFNKGRKVTDGFKENMKIQFHDFLPQWNYSAGLRNHQLWDVIKFSFLSNNLSSMSLMILLEHNKKKYIAPENFIIT